MLNRDIYQKDPSTRKLVNEGVASVNDEKTNQALSVLRYELETFVCDGQYEKGLEHILDVYLKNIEQVRAARSVGQRLLRLGQVASGQDVACLWVDSHF
jgi:hypothetical protein